MSWLVIHGILWVGIRRAENGAEDIVLSLTVGGIWGFKISSAVCVSIWLLDTYMV